MLNKNLIAGFGLKLPDKEEIKIKVNKAKEEKKITKRNTISSKLSLSEKLAVIREEVDRRLGKFKLNTKIIYTEEDLSKYIEHCITNGIVSIDTETNNSIDPITCKIMGACLYTPGDKQVYVPINHVDIETGELLTEVKERMLLPDTDNQYIEIKKPKQITEEILSKYLLKLKEANTKIIMHNAKFDIQVFDFTCFNGEANTLTCYWDTMLAAKILDENISARLKDLYQKYIDSNQQSYNIETFFKGIEYAKVEPETFALYAATDAYETYQLYIWQVEEFNKINDSKLFSVFKDIEMQVLPCVIQMQETGISLDYNYINNLSKSYNEKLNKAKESIDLIIYQYRPLIDKWQETHSGKDKLDEPINVASPKQLAILLYDILKLKSPDKENPRGTGEEILKKLEHPIVKSLLEFREFNKLVSTYVDKLPNDANSKTHKIHANFNQIGVEDRTVVTGRFSSSDPMEYIMNWGQKIRLTQRRAIA